MNFFVEILFLAAKNMCLPARQKIIYFLENTYSNLVFLQAVEGPDGEVG